MSPSEGRWKPILIAALAALAVAGLGALMTDLGPWYADLRKPAWQPPDWLFGPGWTLIFGLCALSGYLAWRGAPNRRGREWIVALFALNGFLNVLWSALFFRLRRPDWALAGAALAFNPVIDRTMSRYSSAAGVLLVPYLPWVSFAAILNLAIVQLNGPF
jgi:translocator protein